MNLNIDAHLPAGKAGKQNTFDAIVVGTGISGGWAAKELTERNNQDHFKVVCRWRKLARHGQLKNNR